MEQAIIEKMKRGDETAFRAFIEKYHTYIFHTVYAVLRNQKDAEDATQEVFLKIYLSLPQYANQGFKTWITRIAVNHAIDMQRKAYRKREEMTDEIHRSGNQPPPTFQKEMSIEDAVIRQEVKRLVHQRLDELPEHYRAVTYGYYIEEKTYQQLAKELDVKTGTIATQLYRARQWMKKHWKESDFL